MDLTKFPSKRLTMLYPTKERSQKSIVWQCKCRCGKDVKVAARDIVVGQQSCGSCNDKENYPEEYNAWIGMKSRCRDVNSKAYKYYGERGISVCDRWQEDFLNFLDDMGRKPSYNLSLDRIDVDGNYEPSNCRWATAREQAINKRFSREEELTTDDLVDIYLSFLSISTLAERYNRTKKTIMNIRAIQYKRDAMLAALQNRLGRNLP